MAKEKDKPNADRDREMTTISVPVEFARKVRTVAASTNENLWEVLERVAGASLARECRKAAVAVATLGGEG